MFLLDIVAGMALAGAPALAVFLFMRHKLKQCNDSWDEHTENVRRRAVEVMQSKDKLIGILCDTLQRNNVDDPIHNRLRDLWMVECDELRKKHSEEIFGSKGPEENGSERRRSDDSRLNYASRRFSLTGR